MHTARVQGFTLVELLIVMAIIGILAAYLIPSVIAAQKKADDAGAIADLPTPITAAPTVLSAALPGFRGAG